MMVRIAAALLSLSLCAFTLGGMGGNTTQLGGLGHSATLTRATCVTSGSNTDTYTFADISTGASGGDAVLVVVVVLSEDSATNFGTNAVTVDGNAASQVVDEDGTGIVNSAIFQYGLTQQADLVTVVVTQSEPTTSATVCVWTLRGLASTTATSSIADDDTLSDALVLTTATTTSGGYVIGGCIAGGGGVTTTWGVLNEREDADNGEHDYSTADLAATGASMANTCDWTSTADASGAAVAYR